MNKITFLDLESALRSLTEASSHQLAEATGGSPATVRRLLAQMHLQGKILKSGQARATRYRLQETPVAIADRLLNPAGQAEIAWSQSALRVLEAIDVPLASREPVSYQREFVENYQPNATALMPPALAEALYQEGRMQGQQPAGTYARKVLEQLLVDLSWSSSRLEGNHYSLLATEELFRSGAAEGDMDAVMLLNHKSAIEFLVDAVPVQGLVTSVVRNLHAVLMQDLLANVDALGTIRTKVVNISDTTYIPLQAPVLLQEMLDLVIAKARQIKNPIESAFFLWVNLAYLQPFEDGNKRTSRLTANIPLLLYNCAPLSFLDVSTHDYARAMLGVYEFLDTSVAVDLFAWTYRRSLKKYKVIMQSLGVPDPFRLRYRESLNEAIGLVVREGKPMHEALRILDLQEEKAPGFQRLLADELATLQIFNCARYRLPMSAVETWIVAGRPQ
jgi:fido (protein-threonine AMPylation protein)